MPAPAVAMLWAGLCIGLMLQLPAAQQFPRPQPALTSSPTSDVAEQQCLAKSLSDVVRVCQANSTASLGDELTKLLRSCLATEPVNPSQLRSRILLVQSPFVDIMRNATKVYQDVTGIPVELVDPPYLNLTQVRTQSLHHPDDPALTHEAWLVSPVAVGDGVQNGAFRDLTTLVPLDSRLQWEDIFPQVRASGLLYQSKVVTMPLNSYAALLYYRRDVFEQYGIQVPRTWTELLDTVQRYNGTAGYHAFCGEWNPCVELGTGMVRQLLASVHQTHGPTDGWFMDADSLLNTSSPRYADMGILLDSPGAVEVFEFMRRLYQWSPPSRMMSAGCDRNATTFLQLPCLMTIDVPILYKYISHASFANRMAGHLGVALLPGSERVLDRHTNTMVPCDAARCPHATRYTNADGSSILVNHSPGFDAALMALNAYTQPDLAFYTFRVVSYLLSQEVNDLMVYEPTTGVYPSRRTQLNPNNWAAAGYDLSDSQQYCAAHRAAFTHENLHVQVRLPVDTLAIHRQMGQNITTSNASVPVILAAAKQAFMQMLAARYQGNMTTLQMDYFAGLNRQLPPANNSASAAVPAVSKDSFSPGLLALAIVLPVLGAMVLAVPLYRFLSQRCLLVRGGWWVPLKHPLPGPLTTLLVTDIENSTPLWEQLPEDVMNTTMVQHDTLVRRLAAAHKGYESVWEGDSFVIAFHSPRPALEFALALQLALLQQPWPPALLEHPMAQDLWARHLSSTPATPTPRRLRSVMPVLQQLSSSLGQRGVSGGSRHASDSQQHSRTPSEPFSPEAAALSGHAVEQQPQGYTPTSSRQLPRVSPDAVAVLTLPAAVSGADADSVTLWQARQQQELRQASTTASHSSSSTITTPSCSQPSATAVPCRSFTSDSALLASPSRDAHTGCAVSHSPRAAAEQASQAHSIVQVPWGAWQQQQAAAARSPQTSEQAAAQRAAADHAIQAQGGTLAPWSTWQQQMAGSWQLCYAGAPGAVLMHRGLRVRVGMSVGAASITYNKTQGRYRYSGPIRALSNAVASAAHGGQIMLDSQTATVLNTLPPECWSLYMGSYILSDVGPAPVHLVMVQPAQLQARLATSCTPLRTHMCCLPGVLHAPAPSTTTKPGLAYMQPSGLSTLLAWDQSTTLQAVGRLHECIQQQANIWDGFIFEDGLLRWMAEAAAGLSSKVRSSNSAASDGSSSPPPSPRDSSSSSSSTTTTAAVAGAGAKALTGKSSSSKPSSSSSSSSSGPLLGVAFPDELRALKFAVYLRQQLLHLQWPPHLLTHALCETLGTAGFASIDSMEVVVPAFSQGFASASHASESQSPTAVPPEIVVSPVEEEEEGESSHLHALAPQPSQPSSTPQHGNSFDGASLRIRPAAKARGVPGTWYELDAPMLHGLRMRMVLLGQVQDVQPCLRTRGYVRASYTAKHSKYLQQLFRLAKQGQILASAHVITAAGWFMPAIPE